MATQSGIIIEAVNSPYTIVANLPRSSPAPKEVLVKSLLVGINPVEPLQQHTGILIKEWPATIGSDYAGIVTAVGSDCTKLKPGDYVYGCAPLGQNKYAPFQESFLVDETTCLRKSPNLSIEDTGTIGAALLTSALCLLAGTGLKLPETGVKAPAKDEWIVVLGGSGSVGQFAVQIASVCGYKVLASCSPSKQSVVIKNGATATFNNRGSVDEQVEEIKRNTGGNFARIFDSTAYGYDVMLKALETASTATTKYLTSVDDWTPFNTPSTIREYRAELGHLGRVETSTGAEVTNAIASWINAFETHLAAGTLVPLEYQLAAGVGWEKVIEGIQDLENGKAAKKIVVKTQEE